MRVVVIGSTREVDERSNFEAIEAIRGAGHAAVLNADIHPALTAAGVLNTVASCPEIQFHAALVPMWQTCDHAVALVKALREYPNVKFITAWGGHEVIWENGETAHRLGDQIPEYKGGKG